MPGIQTLSTQQTAPTGKPWHVVDVSFRHPITRGAFFGETAARAACEILNAQAGRERFKVVWMGA
jgi:hypothetical protein